MKQLNSKMRNWIFGRTVGVRLTTSELCLLYLYRIILTSWSQTLFINIWILVLIHRAIQCTRHFFHTWMSVNSRSHVWIASVFTCRLLELFDILCLTRNIKILDTFMGVLIEQSKTLLVLLLGCQITSNCIISVTFP